MAKDGIKVKGICRIYDAKTGQLLRESKNLIVNAGLNLVRDLVSNLATVPDVPSHLGIGTGSTAAAAADTALESETGSRISATVTEPANYQIKYAGTSAAGSHAVGWTEVGIFNASSSGTMLCRVVFAVLNKGAADSFTIEYTISFSDDGV